MKLIDVLTKSRKSQTRSPDGNIEKSLLLAAGLDPAEAEAVADNPELYRRVQSRINTLARESRSNPWLEILVASRKAAPAMAVVGALAFGGLLYAIERNRTSLPQRPQAVFPGVPDNATVVTACAIGAKQECAISRGEALAIIIPDQEGTQK